MEEAIRRAVNVIRFLGMQCVSKEWCFGDEGIMSLGQLLRSMAIPPFGRGSSSFSSSVIVLSSGTTASLGDSFPTGHSCPHLTFLALCWFLTLNLHVEGGMVLALSFQFLIRRFLMRATIIVAVRWASNLAMPPRESSSTSQVGGLGRAISMRERVEKGEVVVLVCSEDIHDSTIVLRGL